MEMEEVVIMSGDGRCSSCGEVHQQILSKDEEGYVSMWVGCVTQQIERLTSEQAIEMLEHRSRRLYGDVEFMVENDRNAEAMCVALKTL